MDCPEGYVYHIKNEYFAKADNQIEKYGNCLTIVMGEYDGKQAAFLLQNMFAITEKYLGHIHTRNNNAVPVRYSIQAEVSAMS